MTWKFSGVISLVFFILTGCAGIPEIEERPVDLPPMIQPDIDVGYTWTGLRNDEPFSLTIVSDSGDAWDWRSSTGCKFTLSKLGFAPGKKWSDCGARDGRQRSSLIGQIWPLRVGNQWQFPFEGSNSKGTWKDKRDCEVLAAVNIDTRLGPKDTYKIVCEDRWNKRIFHVSPELREFVRWVWYRKNKNKTFVHEITQPFDP